MYKINFMENFRYSLKESLDYINNLFKKYKINYAIIGGVARNFYASTRTTEDIDLLIDNKDKNKLKKIPSYKLKDFTGRNRVYKIPENNTIVEFLFSGEKAGDIHGIEYESPLNIINYREGFPVIDLYNLIKYKISSGIYGKRLKDFGDVQELILENNLSLEYLNYERNDIVKKYQEIWNYGKK